MALTGLEIFKQLPKKNCKECGQPTCLAFAMQLASGKATLDACPHVSDAAKEMLDSASAPPIALVNIGKGEKAFALGNETVLFRHDKRFEHPTGIVIQVTDVMSKDEFLKELEKINNLVFERVGQMHGINMVAILNQSGSADTFAEAVQTAQENTQYPLLLLSEGQTEAIAKAMESVGQNKPVIYAATSENYQQMVEIAKKFDAPLVVKGENLETLADLVEKITGLGYKNLILDSGARDLSRMLAEQTQLRRQALKRFRPFGYPTIAFVNNQDPITESVHASALVAKYAGLVVMTHSSPEYVLPVVTLRLNVYTDPQKPIAVETKIYEVLNPGPDAPVLITTNFSLSYFCVAGDTEGARVPAYIIPVDTDGVSVLTAWAAGKFTPETIAETVKRLGIMDRVSHNKIIIPGGVAVLSGKTAELIGCEVIVGPRESAGLPSFFKQRWLS